jgi:ubiquinone/menaquinone biosynthesis C-methylase UbiE
MTTNLNVTDRLATRAINGLLSVKPLANFAKQRARKMIIDRAEAIGVPWRENVSKLRGRGAEIEFDRSWQTDLTELTNPNLVYPTYYLTSFHAYAEGNMSWDAAMEVESAAYSVHARIFEERGTNGDTKLRQSYHNLLTSRINTPPTSIVDIGCSVGMSTFALQSLYPDARLTGIDLSPYFLSVARYRDRQYHQGAVNWLHAAGEATGLADSSVELVSIFLVCHELPQSATKAVFAEAHRILKPGGHIAMMDMNPDSPIYSQMPAYVLTLLKSTEPYLDRYFTLDIDRALTDAGFHSVSISSNSPRHRTVIAQK